jgi:hypothetical protein
MSLFGRTVRLLVGPPGEEGLDLSDLRISFSVEKRVKGQPNKAEITVYNLSENTRKNITVVNNRVLLYAGYDEPGLLFFGDITKVEHSRVNEQWSTKIQATDGGQKLRETRVSESFKEGATGEQVINRLANLIGIPVGELSVDLGDAFANGFSAVGPAKDIIDTLSKKFGFDWSVQNNELQIINKDSSTQQDAVLLTPETGLIGTPQPVTKDAQKLDLSSQNDKFTARTLIDSRLTPGRKVQIESREVNGLFRVDTIGYVGDTHGNDWYSDIEVSEL